MFEHYWAKRFNSDLDKCLSGKPQESDYGPQEYQELIDLSQELIALDLSAESLIKDKLLSRLLNSLAIEKQEILDKDELSEDNLSNVAGGINCEAGNPPQRFCTCQQSVDTPKTGICPICHLPKGIEPEHL
ncbi:MAG: hypothetical protein APF81_20190 [Desulfosporosinus sp. BRH_c37]|nr:MAG: hypothetical protein APF81_20190 [Desulfosporosinus sp. BRH_c37]